MDKAQIEKIIDSVLPEIIELRHKIHQNPELAGKEFETATLIKETLKPTNIKILDPFLETDVVGMLEGKNPGKNVSLRGDIDALPLQEETDLPYKSKNDGVMHACGHDGHTAVILGAALVLSQLKEHFDGSVRFVFQPGEEQNAMGHDLVKAGVLENPKADSVYSLHGFPTFPVGAVATKPGTIMVAAEFFTIIIKGKGGHGSKPEASVDPILTGCRVVEALQSIASRNVPPLDPVVVSICKFKSGFNGNVIPDTAELEGTTRYLNPEVGDKLPELMERYIKGVCDAMGAEYEFIYDKTYIPTVNDPKLTAFSKEVTGKYLGEENWVEMKKPSMGGEDFSFYLKDHPGVYFHLGMGENSAPLHNSHFNFNDDAIKNGIMLMTAMAIESLK